MPKPSRPRRPSERIRRASRVAALPDGQAIFVSYAREDTSFASALSRRLQTAGFTVSRDVDIPGGDKWWNTIERMIAEARTVVLCLSKHALASNIVMDELAHARRVGTRVIPVLADDVQPAHAPRWLSKLQWLDLRSGIRSNSAAWRKLLAGLRSTGERVRVPFTVPDLPRHIVSRTDDKESFLRTLLQRGSEGEVVAITTTIQGAGGIGKTTLALMICHDARIRDAFSDGVLWITLGQTPDVRALIQDQIALLTSARPEYGDINIAATVLSGILRDRDILVVLDDVWQLEDAQTFSRGTGRSAFVVTTRNQNIAQELTNDRISLGPMNGVDSAALLTRWLERRVDDQAAVLALADELGHWPLMLRLVGTYIGEVVRTEGLSVLEAFSRARERLRHKGVASFELRNERDRTRAIAASIEVSIDALQIEFRERFRELAIFPEDTWLPASTVATLWRSTAAFDAIDTEDALRAMRHLSLLDWSRAEGGAVQLHDIVRSYLRSGLGSRLAGLHERFLSGFAVDRWHELQKDEPYLWDHLVYHLIEAGRTEDVLATVQDVRYLCAKTSARNELAAERDLTLIEASVPGGLSVSPLRRVFANLGHLLARCREPNDLATALAARLPHLSNLANTSRREDGLPGPLLLTYLPPPDLPHPALLRTMSVGPEQVNSCAIAPEGCIWSAHEDGTLHLWQIETGREVLKILVDDGAGVRACASTPSGERIVSVTERDVKIWDARTGKLRHTLRGHSDSVVCCAVSIDGSFIVSGSYDETLRVWDAKTGRLRRVLTGHTKWVVDCAISPDSTLVASAGYDHTLRVWDIRTGAVLHCFKDSDNVRGCAFAPDGRYVMGVTLDSGPSVWDLRTGVQTRGKVAEGAGYCCAFSPRGDSVVTGGPDGLRLWSWPELEAFPLVPSRSHITSCVFTDDGRSVVATSRDGTIRTWDVDALRRALPDESPDDQLRVVDLIVSPHGTLAIAGGEEMVAAFNVSSGARRWNVPEGLDMCSTSTDGLFFVSAYFADLCVRRFKTGTLRRRFTRLAEASTDYIGSCAINSNSTLVASGHDSGVVRLWSLDSGGLVHEFQAHDDRVRSCDFLNDHLLTCGGDTVYLWDLTTRQKQLIAKGCEKILAVSHASNCVVGMQAHSDSHDMGVWELPSGRLRLRLRGHHDWVWRGAISRDGTLIASASFDHSLKIWDSKSGECLVTFHTDEAFYGCGFLPDGKRLIAANRLGLYFLRFVR